MKTLIRYLCVTMLMGYATQAVAAPGLLLFGACVWVSDKELNERLGWDDSGDTGVVVECVDDVWFHGNVVLPQGFCDGGCTVVLNATLDDGSIATTYRIPMELSLDEDGEGDFEFTASLYGAYPEVAIDASAYVDTVADLSIEVTSDGQTVTVTDTVSLTASELTTYNYNVDYAEGDPDCVADLLDVSGSLH